MAAVTVVLTLAAGLLALRGLRLLLLLELRQKRAGLIGGRGVRRLILRVDELLLEIKAKALSRAVHVRPYLRYSSINIAQRFTADSVLGEMTTDGGVRRPIAHTASRTGTGMSSESGE